MEKLRALTIEIEVEAVGLDVCLTKHPQKVQRSRHSDLNYQRKGTGRSKINTFSTQCTRPQGEEAGTATERGLNCAYAASQINGATADGC